MNKQKNYNFILIIAVIVDLFIFGILIYSNKLLKERIVKLDKNYLSLERKFTNQLENVSEIDEKLNKLIDNLEKEEKLQNEVTSDYYYEAVKNLDKQIFLTDFENYMPVGNEIKISENEAKKIAQKGFEESKSRIAGEGADDVDSETIKIEEVPANNYFTRLYSQGNEVYTEIKRKCYIIQRENDMGCGIKIYVDVTTGLIIGGEAFGD